MTNLIVMLQHCHITLPINNICQEWQMLFILMLNMQFIYSSNAWMFFSRFSTFKKDTCVLLPLVSPQTTLTPQLFFAHFDMRQWATQPKVIWQQWGLTERLFLFPRESAFLHEPLASISPQEHLGASLPLRKQQSTSGLRAWCRKKIIRAEACLRADINCKLIVTCWQPNLKEYLTLFGGVLLSAPNALREHFRALCLKAFPSLFSVWSLTLPQVTNL